MGRRERHGAGLTQDTLRYGQLEENPGLHRVRRQGRSLKFCCVLFCPLWVPNDHRKRSPHVDILHGVTLGWIPRLNTNARTARKRRGAVQAPAAARSRTCGKIRAFWVWNASKNRFCGGWFYSIRSDPIFWGGLQITPNFGELKPCAQGTRIRSLLAQKPGSSSFSTVK